MKHESRLFGIIMLMELILISACTQTIKPKPANETTIDKEDTNIVGEQTQQKLCNTGSGVWKEFPNSGQFCHDECNKPKRVICQKFMSMGCDCGPDKCWDGLNCING